MHTTQQNSATKHLRHRAEGGFSTLIQGLFYVVLLWMCFGLVYDIGGAVLASTRLRSAAFLAAQDGAKMVDTTHYQRFQEWRLSNRAVTRAMQVFDGATQGMNANAYVAVVTQGPRDMVIVTARAPVRMRSTASSLPARLRVAQKELDSAACWRAKLVCSQAM